MKASDLFVRSLEAEGVTTVFGLPGEENLDLIESLRSSKIRFVVTRHEQAAGIMAATWGRLTGKTGVCLSTLGPGATNLVTAAAYAELGAMPMLMITGQKPIRTSKQGQFQLVDVVPMMRPLTKYTQTIVSADGVSARVREAFRRAQEERPGAVHLELPEDVARDATDRTPIAPSFTRRAVADEGAIVRAIDAISSAKRPLIMIGAGANRKRDVAGARGARRAHRHSVLHDADGQRRRRRDTSAFPRDGGAVSRRLRPPRDRRGRLRDQRRPRRDREASVLHAPGSHDHPRRLLVRRGRLRLSPDLEVTGDIANALWRLSEGLPPATHWDFSFFLQVRKAFDAHVAAGSADDRFPIHPQRLVAEVRSAVPADGIVCLDNGMYKIWFARHYACRVPGTLLLDNALATMGAGLPSAIAAKLVHPERKVMAVAGDGGFMMSSQELETAVRLGLDLTVLVVRDDGYGMIRWKQQDMGFASYGMSVGNPDFVRYAEAFGAHGHRPTSAGELGPMLERCLATPGVHVVDVPIDYSEDGRALGEELAQAAARV